MARPVDLAKGSRFLILASICVVVAALYFAQEVLIPLALSVLITFLLAPLVTRLERWKLGRVPSVVIVVCLGIGLMLGIGWIVTRQMVRLLDDLPKYQKNIVTHVRDLRGGGGGMVQNLTDKVGGLANEITKPADTQPASNPTSAPAGRTPEDWREVIAALRQPAVPKEVVPGTSPERPVYTKPVEEPQSPAKAILANAGLVLGPAATAGLVIVVVLFMLLAREDLRDRMIRLVGKGQIHVTTTALNDAGERISRYLLAQAIVNGSYGFVVARLLWLIGRIFGRNDSGTYEPFPSVIVWGMLCGVLRFVPYIGPWIAAAFPIALSFAVYPNYSPFIATVIMFVVIELWSNNVMEPWLYGSSTGMSAVAILVAAVFWTWLWGPIGLLLATPLTVCLVVIGKYVPQLQFLDVLLGDEPALEPHDRVYQRLLAMDQEEATELVEEYLEERPIEQVYDEVLMPALALAEQDGHRGRLDQERQAFVRRAMRDIVEDVRERYRLNAERDAAAQVRQAAEETVKAAKTGARPLSGGDGSALPAGTAGAARLPAGTGNGNLKGAPATALPAGATGAPPTGAGTVERPMLPTGCVVNIVLLPAHDDADEIAALMLSHLLELRGFCSFPVAVARLASEMVEAVEKRQAHVVCVSAMPPAAVTHSRYLCKRLHGKFPDFNMVVGLWTARGDLKKAKDRITCSTNVQVATTLVLFVLVYGIVFAAGITYVNRLINKGPTPEDKLPEGVPNRPLSGATSPEATVGAET